MTRGHSIFQTTGQSRCINKQLLTRQKLTVALRLPRQAFRLRRNRKSLAVNHFEGSIS